MDNSGKINGLKITVSKFVIIFSLIIIAANSVILVFRGYQSYYREIEAAKLDIDRLSRTISDHIDLTFIAVDVLLKRAVEKHHSNLLFGRSKSVNADTQNNVISWVNETPQISAMLMTNEFGEITAIYRKDGFKLWMEGYETVEDQEFFTKQLEDDDDLYIGYQKTFVRDDRGFIIMSRKLNKLDGSFDGIILAAVSIDYITNFFDSIERDKKSQLLLKHIDGDFLITPKGLDENKEKESFTNIFLDVLSADKERIGKVFVKKTSNSYDRKLRLYSFYESHNLPLQVSLIFFGDDILTGWKSERISDIVFYIIFLLFVVVVAFFSVELAKKVQKLRISEARAQAASKAKSDFLANMSHELRTPLNAIIGFSEMISDGYFGEVNEKQKDRLKDINSCGNHLLAVINDVLEFSKGNAGKLELRPELVSVKKLFDEVVRIFDERIKKEGLNIVTSIYPDIEAIFIDKRKIKQVLINLISNSVKFTEEGGIISLSSYIDDNGNYCIAVKDTGVGMEEADIPKALAAFGQVHDDVTKGGTGLGLPLCKLFAELHNGILEIKSKKNNGTIVTVILPKTVIQSNIQPMI